MSQDYPNRTRWLATRATSANLHRTRGRVFFAGPGTYVRLTGDAKADARLEWYQRQCNANAAPIARRRRRA